MADFKTDKKTFDMSKLSVELEKYSKQKEINADDYTKIRLVAEEYLTNILFPNFDGSVEISILNSDKGLEVIFSHKGADYMNKITDNSFLSFKILDNKTKEIQSSTQEGVTSVKFIIK